MTPSPAEPPGTDSPALIRAISVTSTAAIMPGRIVMNGTNIFGNAPMIGVRRAAEIESEAIARCTSTKLVVQYPNDSTKPRPNTMPTTESSGESNPESSCPGQELSWSVAEGEPFFAASSVIRSLSPPQPPTRFSPSRASGSSAATITKNCSTSL